MCNIHMGFLKAPTNAVASLHCLLELEKTAHYSNIWRVESYRGKAKQILFPSAHTDSSLCMSWKSSLASLLLSTLYSRPLCFWI